MYKKNKKNIYHHYSILPLLFKETHAIEGTKQFGSHRVKRKKNDKLTADTFACVIAVWAKTT